MPYLSTDDRGYVLEYEIKQGRNWEEKQIILSINNHRLRATARLSAVNLLDNMVKQGAKIRHPRLTWSDNLSVFFGPGTFEN